MMSVLAASVLSGCGAAQVPEPVEQVVPEEDVAPAEVSVEEPGQEVGILIGTCPEGGSLSMAGGQERPDGEPMRMEAYLVAHAEPCPPCPEDAQCEACAPPYELYSDVPPGGTGAGGSGWVTPGWLTQPPTQEDMESIPVGAWVLLCGAWEPDSEPGASHVFRLTGLQVLAP
jgi:hypothetical protein